MSEKLVAPDVRRTIGDHERRLGILERRITTRTATAATVETVMFSYAGTLTTGTSPPARILPGGILTVLAVTLGTAGTSSTVIDVERNGTTVATVTVPSGTTVHNGEVNARFAADSDKLTLTIISAGTGAADMTAAARFT